MTQKHRYMKKTFVLIPILFVCLVSLSQNIKTFSPIYVTSCFNCFYQRDPSINLISVYPDWLYTNPSFVRTIGVKRDSVFVYEKKEKSRDSVLIMAQFFDSTGNLTEKEEYSVKNKGEIWRFTHLSYLEDQLMKEEIITRKEERESNTDGYEKRINTYEYDSAGNMITVKQYDFGDNSSKKYDLKITEYNYDASGRLIKTFTKSGASSFLSAAYTYDKDGLLEIRGYDYANHLLFKNLLQNDHQNSVTRIYRTEAIPANIIQEYYYNDQNKLRQQIAYSGNNIIISSQTYTYDPNGLIGKQNLIYINNNFYYYYKHHYSGQ
jgi:hypothetical protein